MPISLRLFLPLVLLVLSMAVPASASAAIAHRATTQTALTTAGTSVTVSSPAGTAVGDVLIAQSVQNGTSTGTVTEPASFTTWSTTPLLTAVRLRTHVKIVTGTEPANYTFTFSNSSKHIVSVSAYSGVNNNSAIDKSAAKTNTGASQMICPSLDAVAGDMYICSGASLNGDLHTFPAGMTERADARTGSTLSDRSLGVGDEARSTTGATGTRTVTLTTPEDNLTHAITLTPAGGTPPPAPAACEDGLDNDSDGKIDYPADPGCSSLTDTSETDPPPATVECNDGVDNADPEDTLVDLADPGCSSSTDTDETNTPPPSGTLYYSNGAEDGTTSSFGTEESCVPNNDVRTVTSPVFTGTRSFESVATQVGCPTSGSIRAELRHSSTGPGSWAAGDTRFIGFSVYMSSAFPTGGTSGDHCLVFQVRSGPSGNDFDLQCRNNQWALEYGQLCGGPWGAIVRGGWSHFVFETKSASSANGGYVSVWYKAPGASTYTKVKSNCANNTVTSGYRNHPKIGRYHGAAYAGGSVYHDNFKVGSTFDIVAP